MQFTLDPSKSRLVTNLKHLAGLFPLTLQGVVTLLLSAGALTVYGYGRLDLVVFALAICALAILIFCLFCSIISGLLIQRRIQKHLAERGSEDLIRLEAGFPNESGFHTPAMRYFPLVKLAWQVVYPDFITTRIRVSEETSLTEELIPQRRCRTAEVMRHFTVADVLGFCRFSWYMTQPSPCLVLPRVNTLKTLPMLRSITAEDGIPNPLGNPEGDRMEIRPYVPGDSVRNIMWKVYARNRQLNVRLAEKSVFHSQRTLAYLVSSPNDEAAAAAARVALESGALGDDWAFGADGTERPCEDLNSALEAVAASRAISQPHPYGLDNFLRNAAAQAGVHCLVFAAAETGTWLPELRNTIARNPGHFSLILATDGFATSEKPGLLRRLLLRRTNAPSGTPPAAGSREEMLRLLTEVGQLVESTVVIDRHSGLSFDKGLHKV